MATVPMDERKVAQCRELAAHIAEDVQSYIDRHTTVGVERTIVRAFGVEGADDQGAPLVNVVVDRYHKAGLLGHGISFFLGRALLAGAKNPQDAAERLAFGPELDRGEVGPDAERASQALEVHVAEALARIDRARDEREALKASVKPGETPLK